jgi:superfamily II DNA or RNA helicase
VYTGLTTGAETHGELVAALAADEARNRRIVALVAAEASAGHTTLVLSGRVEHCELVAEMLRAAGVDAAALTGKAARGQRRELLGRFRAGHLPVLCATSLADEGLDVPRLDRLVLATPARAEGRTIQRLGRLMRPHAGKGRPVLFDLVDEGRMAAAQYRARCAAYRKVLGAAPTPRRPA